MKRNHNTVESNKERNEHSAVSGEGDGYAASHLSHLEGSAS